MPQPRKRQRKESSTDLQERAAILSRLRDLISSQGGTQADKAERLGITQPRLNDLLKERVEKFSLDGLVTLAVKAGMRVDVNVQEVAIRRGPSRPYKNKQIVSTLAPEPGDLGSLDAEQGTRLVQQLLRCEAISLGLNPKDVVVSLRINDPDGGIDAKVGCSLEAGSLIAEGITHFQIKTGSSFKPWQKGWIKKELFGKSTVPPSKRLLGEAVRECLDNDGTLRFITLGYDLLPSQHTRAIQTLVELLFQCGYEHPKVDVIGQGQLIGEIEKYPSICLDLVGLSDGGFLTYKSWSNNSQMQVKLELGKEQEGFLNEVREAILGNDFQHVRVIGEPGIGKTRLVLEAISMENIAPSVVYIPSGEDFQKSKLSQELLKRDRNYTVTLVIDDCDVKDRASIWSVFKGLRNIKIVSIDHGPEDSADSAMKTMRFPKLNDDQIKKILLSYLGTTHDLTNWAEWCEGSPRVAHAVGENLKNNDGDILKSPADVPIWDRFIIGHKEMGSADAEQHRMILRHISLFNKFGFESPVSDEAKFIATLVQRNDPSVTWGRFQTIVQHYRDKRILQGRHTLFIVPKALRIHLWVDFWKKYGTGFDFTSFFNEVPESMKHWFLELFKYAHEPESARTVVKQVLSPKGPFSEKSFLESKVGLRFLNYLAEADPNATLCLIERTIGSWDRKKLMSWEAGRQDIVWALEKIAVWEELFPRAVEVLAIMAVAENSKYGNNAKGTLLGLFSVGMGWAPTQAPPSKRLPKLRQFVSSEDKDRRALGLEICEKWLKTRGGARQIGPEYQGLRPPIKFWLPQTYGEVFDPWREVLELLRNELNNSNEEERIKIAGILIHAGEELLDVENLRDEVFQMLFELAKEPDLSRKKLTKLVIRKLRFRSGNLDEESIAKLQQLDEFITGKSLLDKITRYVLNTDWDEDWVFKNGEPEEDSLPVNRVVDLATQLVGNINDYSAIVPKLIRSNGHRLVQLGEECGKAADSIVYDDIVKKELESDGVNGAFAGGYLKGKRSRNFLGWEKLLLHFLEEDKTRKVSVDLVWISGCSQRIITKMLELYRQDKLSANAFNRLPFSREEGMTEADVLQVVNTLLEKPDKASVGICIEHFYSFYIRKEKALSLPEEITFSLLSSPFSGDSDDSNMGDYYWGNVAEKFLEKYPFRAMDLFASILSREDRLSPIGTSQYISQVADNIVGIHPSESWKIISNKLEGEYSTKQFEITNWLGDSGFGKGARKEPISLIPADEIISWIDEDKEKRLHTVSSMLPQTLSVEEGGMLTKLFIEKYCGDESIVNSVISHFCSGMWSGPVSIHYSEKRDAARKWFGETDSSEVQQWLGKYIDRLSDSIEEEQIREERKF